MEQIFENPGERRLGSVTSLSPADENRLRIERDFFGQGGVPETRTERAEMPMPSASDPSARGGRFWTGPSQPRPRFIPEGQRPKEHENIAPLDGAPPAKRSRTDFWSF
jgi:hypothetical protein